MLTYVDALTPKTLNPTLTHQGGIAHEVDRWARLRRFLILGSDGGSFYINARELTLENAAAVRECLDEDAARAIGEIQTVSESGRAPKNEPAILALAIASAHEDAHVREQAFEALPYVCRTGTHLLHFAAYRKALGAGWGRGMRRAVGAWFTRKSPRDLAYQAVKYPSRDGWALADLLRLAHPKVRDEELNFVLGYIVDGWPEQALGLDAFDSAEFLNVCRLLHDSDTPDMHKPALIAGYRIPREAVPTELLTHADVWDALLTDMPMTAMIRNLGKMSAVGLLASGSDAERMVTERLLDAERLKAARVHPLALLVALKVYQQGHGDKGSLEWRPSKRVVTALDEAFYLAFGAVEPTGKRLCLALDVSGSMTWDTIAGMPLTPREASAAMALVTVAVEPQVEVVGFSHTLTRIALAPTMRLDEAIRLIERVPYGGTRPELPMRVAMEQGIDFDAFFTYTDNETGSPVAVWDVLREYRERQVKHARHACVAMEANQFSLADPDDSRQLDVVGFDTATPQILSEFAAGRI